MPSKLQNQKLGVAIVGCGHWGPNHIRNFSAHQRAQVICCVDTDSKQLDHTKELFPSVEVTPELEKVLRDSRIDAVVISTPTNTHYDLTRQALLCGKHVLCEKPLSCTTAQAEELRDLAQRAVKILMVGHVFLFNPGIQKLRELIVAGEVGNIHYLHATRTNLGPIRHDVDSVWDLAPHDISIMNYLLGQQPLEVSARGSHYLQEGKVDVAFITMTYPNNVLANIHVSWLDPKKVRQLTVVGDRKMVTWDDMTPGSPISIYDKGVVREAYYKDFGEFQLVTKEGDIVIPKVRAVEPLRAQTDFFIDAVEKGAVDLCTAEEGLQVVRVLEAIERSMKLEGAPVAVGPSTRAGEIKPTNSAAVGEPV